MSSIGSPIQNSLAQVAQAQLQAAKARDRNRGVSESARHFADAAEQRVAGLDTADAVRALNEQDQHDDQRGKQQQADHSQTSAQDAPSEDPPSRPRLDVKA
jgi:hypothetical protein